MDYVGTRSGSAGETGHRPRAEDQDIDRRSEADLSGENGSDLFRVAVETALADHGASRETAAIVAKQAVEWLQRHAGSQRLWIASVRSSLHEAIRSEFTGRNLGELAARYGVHVRTVRRIVASRQK